jgi:hypothetical protein
MGKYAVLISGVTAEKSGKDEFWNDLVLIREALINNNNFLIENIYVLYGDGNDCKNPNRPKSRYSQPPIKPSKQSVTDFAANIAEVKRVFNDLANGTNGMPKLKTEDMLFVWTFGHGFTLLIGCFLCLNDWPMDNWTFASLMNQIPCSKRIICMQQCFSGGFINSLGGDDRNVILTACNQFQIANRSDDKPAGENEVEGGVTYHHGEFNYHLYSAIADKTINGVSVNADVNSDRKVTLDEVFNYIKNNESRSTTESTQYKDGNQRIGRILTLK